MKLGRRQVFERIDPPSGGLARLRARLDAEQGRGRSVGSWLAASAVAAAAAVALLAHFGPALTTQGPETTVAALPGTPEMGPALAALGLAPPAPEPVLVPASDRDATAVRRVPLSNDDVVFYWVATRSSSEDALAASVAPVDSE